MTGQDREHLPSSPSSVTWQDLYLALELLGHMASCDRAHYVHEVHGLLVCTGRQKLLQHSVCRDACVVVPGKVVFSLYIYVSWLLMMPFLLQGGQHLPRMNV